MDEKERVEELRYELERFIDIKKTQTTKISILIVAASSLSFLFTALATIIISDLINIGKPTFEILLVFIIIEIILSTYSIWFSVYALKSKCYVKSIKNVRMEKNMSYENLIEKYTKCIDKCYKENKKVEKCVKHSRNLFLLSLFLLPILTTIIFVLSMFLDSFLLCN